MAITTLSSKQLNQGILNSFILPNTPINFSFTNPSGSSYFCIETVTTSSMYDSNSLKGCDGNWVVSESMGFVTSYYIAGAVIQNSSSSITFTPSNTIPIGGVKFRGTGEYTLIITT
jgi:hypothetical protein